MKNLSSLALVLFVLLFVGQVRGEQLTVFKHDQFSADIAQAAEEISGLPLAVQPGFIAGEAFGQIYVPEPGAYPVKITGVDVIVAAPPNGGEGKTDVEVEIWFVSNPGSPKPEKEAPDFTLSTHDLFNPSTGEFGMPLQGNSAFSFEFDWTDPEGHPPVLTQGAFIVMIRFTEPAADLQNEWGTMQCAKMPELGMCGCQQVGALTDKGTTPNANILNITSGLGNCQGPAGTWEWANKIGVTGDFILRARALTQGGGCVPNCGSNECGPDGCGGSCGDCAEGMICQNGKCVPEACKPQCEGKECGPDGCGGSCGDCQDGYMCDAGKCVPEGCIPACEGKECGDDGCGGSCGECGEGEVCVQGLCKAGTPCQPECEGKECGDDKCGGVCGVCGPGEICIDGHCKAETSSAKLMISHVDPAWGYNDQETPVSIVGAGFKLGANARIGGTNMSAVLRVSDTLISATVPKGLAPGKYMVFVINPDEETASLPDAFEVRERPHELAGSSAEADSGCSVTAAKSAPGAAGALLLVMLVAGLAALRVRSRVRDVDLP